jgi:hypothetical protein
MSIGHKTYIQTGVVNDGRTTGASSGPTCAVGAPAATPTASAAATPSCGGGGGEAASRPSVVTAPHPACPIWKAAHVSTRT